MREPAQRKSIPGVTREASHQSASEESLRVLIVDDDEGLLSALARAFEEESYRITTISNGLDAIESCRRNHYHIVISDIRMPGASGMEVLAEVRKMSPETLVILITGFASLETAVKAIREGAYDYITKPIRLEEIKLVVKNAAERIRLSNENRKLLRELQEAYEQLHLLKAILGKEEHQGVGDPRKTTGEHSEKTLIAGSLIPVHLIERSTPDGALTDLERLSRLRKEGVISSKEFEQCKAKILQNWT
ncbi:MAG: sigma-54-dependent Fis family transcriptional regulator [Deltaproteobacteria bacterium]|nr:sigma-54-dependent Fis family transcriptional regulator [Deltaproteobacteria bacterium]MBW1922092.1 sigma-54-dependent Fis family transcriptional regulator [Deltaproteobacteria bacterium]MBW1947909.1 sigma-54-dependent Fis family transcriptional regulator [Deltaproteobacteria bacterium]MBW2007245.1 sigma-54-dependent Fis family transcriptional regulator [Deltaproteobacteria bacterium]MBW2102390.1 sigma-54-dependent Fis family transcriptional regulator [Deltaproteobacteria bacterium]